MWTVPDKTQASGSFNVGETNFNQEIALVTTVGLEKSVVQSSETSRFSLWASNFLFPLAQWPRDYKSLKEQVKTCPGQAKFESYLSQGGKLEFKFLLNPEQTNSTNLKTTGFHVDQRFH